MGLGAATLIYSGSLLSLLESCRRDAQNGVAWSPAYLNRNQARTISELCAIILPEQEDLPGALSLGIPQFIDKYLNECASDEERETVQKAFQKFDAQLTEQSGHSVEKSQLDDYMVILKQNFDSPDTRNEAFDLLNWVRGKAIWAWQNNKTIAEDLFWYDPIPGKWVGCRPMNEDGDGRLQAL